MSANTIRVPKDLLAELQAVAAAEGKSVDQLAEDALRRHLARQSLERWKRDAERRRRGITDDQVEDIVSRAIREVRRH